MEARTAAWCLAWERDGNGLNQYTGTTSGGTPSATFTYDANGNLISDGSNNYVYDAENRLVSASGGHVATLAYDPLGRLWQVSVPTGTTRFLYDGDKLAIEYDGSNNVLRAYDHGASPDEPLVWYEAVPGGVSRRYLHADHQGSIIAVADQNGNPIAINAYDAWGIPNAANLGRFGYTGQAWLPELGMWYFKARLYSPTLGRFLQTDPVGYKDQINLYSYVENDPVDRTDPTGEQLVEHNPDDHEIVTRVNAVASTTQAQTLHLDAQNTVTMQRSGSLVSVRLTHTEQTKSFMGVSIKVSVAFTGRGTISQRPGEVKVRDINLRSNSLLATVQSSPKELVFRNERNGSVGIHSDGPLIISTPTKPVVIPPLNIIANPPKKKEDERK